MATSQSVQAAIALGSSIASSKKAASINILPGIQFSSMMEAIRSLWAQHAGYHHGPQGDDARERRYDPIDDLCPSEAGLPNTIVLLDNVMPYNDFTQYLNTRCGTDALQCNLAKDMCSSHSISRDIVESLAYKAVTISEICSDEWSENDPFSALLQENEALAEEVKQQTRQIVQMQTALIEYENLHFQCQAEERRTRQEVERAREEIKQLQNVLQRMQGELCIRNCKSIQYTNLKVEQKPALHFSSNSVNQKEVVLGVGVGHFFRTWVGLGQNPLDPW